MQSKLALNSLCIRVLPWSPDLIFPSICWIYMLCALVLGSSVNSCVTSVNIFAKWSFININISVSSRLILTVSLTGSSMSEEVSLSVCLWGLFFIWLYQLGRPTLTVWDSIMWGGVLYGIKKNASQELAFSIVHFLNEGTVRTAASCSSATIPSLPLDFLLKL